MQINLGLFGSHFVKINFNIYAINLTENRMKEEILTNLRIEFNLKGYY